MTVKPGLEAPVPYGPALATAPPCPVAPAPVGVVRSTAAPTVAEPDSPKAAYVSRLVLSDVLAVVASVSLAQLVRFGYEDERLHGSGAQLGYSLVSLVLMASWLIALSAFRAREPKVIGTGAEEYRRIAHASLALFGVVAIAAYLSKLDVARGYLAVALPAGLGTLLATRWLWRTWLVRQRAAGRFITTVLVVGAHHTAAAMARLFEGDPRSGYRVVGVCVPGWASAHRKLINLDGHAVPVLGDTHDVLSALEATRAEMVAVSNTESIGVEGMRSLAWQLEAVDVDLVVSSGVLDVAGPRMQIRPVAGLPLLHVDKPQYRGASRVGKVLVDVVVAAAALLVLSPLLVLVALAIKLTSRGPVFYRAERIGLNGAPFAMLKFRSMELHADRRKRDLYARNEGAGPLFKLRNDPRVTPVGRLLRRLSIDELPQLFNVLSGQMSVVGPRPPLREEVVNYSGDVHRRLLVKPGITGLWQVSGRSDLSWEQSVRLDLYYVENWSMIQDLTIIWRTVGAVLRSSGAY